jgi:hypothetical protein
VGPQGTQSGGHGHADALSVCLQSHGHSLLIDPGTYEYVGSGGDRDLFRGTAMHNTLRVDRANQAEPATPFSWKSLTQSKVERWIQGKNFDLLMASHDGYQRLEQPVTHRRWVVSLKNGTYLVRDVAEGRGTHRLEIAWHLAQDLQLVEEGLFRVKGASHGLALLPMRGHGWAEEVGRESWSPAYGQRAPMTVLNFGANVALPAEFATLLVTLEEAHQVPGEFTRIANSTTDSEVRGYKYASKDIEYWFVFGKSGKPWRKDSLSSDADFVCRRRNLSSADEHLILCGGSFAQFEGGVELRCARPVEWAELVVAEGVRTKVSSDMAAVEGQPATVQQSVTMSLRSE